MNTIQFSPRVPHPNELNTPRLSAFEQVQDYATDIFQFFNELLNKSQLEGRLPRSSRRFSFSYHGKIAPSEVAYQFALKLLSSLNPRLKHRPAQFLCDSFARLFAIYYQQKTQPGIWQAVSVNPEEEDSPKVIRAFYLASLIEEDREKLFCLWLRALKHTEGRLSEKEFAEKTIELADNHFAPKLESIWENLQIFLPKVERESERRENEFGIDG